jgi:hypothetical protein
MRANSQGIAAPVVVKEGVYKVGEEAPVSCNTIHDLQQHYTAVHSSTAAQGAQPAAVRPDCQCWAAACMMQCSPAEQSIWHLRLLHAADSCPSVYQECCLHRCCRSYCMLIRTSLSVPLLQFVPHRLSSSCVLCFPFAAFAWCIVALNGSCTMQVMQQGQRPVAYRSAAETRKTIPSTI